MSVQSVQKKIVKVGTDGRGWGEEKRRVVGEEEEEGEERRRKMFVRD